MSPQSSIGPYRITAKIGEGGMGAVYRATDTKLNREVALKVLPPEFAADTDRIQRFEREAQLLAALNHPNIATIHGIESGAIVMELVEGETLPSPVPLETALNYARQIAAGLEAAHEKGIVHRDLKPANIRVTPDGRVKILDFGLAKSAVETASSVPAASPTISPTLSMAMTQAGVILGTAAYMAPEQARGNPVDKRADIWAFGVVLYEMLTGRQLFGGGETVTDTLASVVKDRPDLDALPVETPPHIRRLIERCLRKDPSTRLRDIGEARIAIEEAPPPSPAPPAVASSKPAVLPWTVALALAIAGGIGWWRATLPRALQPLARVSVDAPPLAGFGGLIAFSSDGLRIAVAARDKDDKVRLQTRLLRQDQFHALAGTEDGHSPFFSPDGQWLGFSSGGKLRKIPVEGGPVTTLCDALTLRGASWSDDGTIVFAPGVGTPLMRIAASGGTPTQLTKLAANERTHRWPHVPPRSRVVLFTAHSNAVNYDDASIEAVDLSTGARKSIRRGGFGPQFVTLPDGSGRLLYLHQGSLFAGSFDAAVLAARGDFAEVVPGIPSSAANGSTFAVSRAGAMLYVQGPLTNGGLRIVWADQSSQREAIIDTPGTYLNPRISPDGKRLAFSALTAQASELRVKDLERDTVSRLSFMEGVNASPVWTPDGKHIVFRSTNQPNQGLYWVRSDGSGGAHRLTSGDEVPYSFSPDGRRLAFWAPGVNHSADLFTASIQGGPDKPSLGPPELFLGPLANEATPAFSPDGRWIAYTSDESGATEIYVRSFADPAGRWQISNGGGGTPIWSRHGELLYLGPDQHIVAVPYAARGDAFIAGKARRWSEIAVPIIGAQSAWDLAPDAKRMAAVLPGDEKAAASRLLLLMNFADELQRRAPAQ